MVVLSLDVFFNEAFFGIVIYQKTDDGFIIKDLNPEAESISKVKRDKVIGRKVTDIFPNVIDYGVYGALEETYKDGKTRTLPLRQYKDDVLSQWSENIIFRLPNNYVVAFYNDYTGSKLLEDDLRRSEEEKRLILDSLPDTVSLKDPDYRYIWVNKVLREQFGLPLDEIIGKKCYELAWGIEVPCDYCKVEEAIETRDHARNINKFIDGTIRETITVPFFVGDELIGTLEIGRDVTERESLRENLQNTLKDYQILTNGSMDAIVVNNEERFVFANQKAADLFGYEKVEDMLGNPFIDHFPPDEQRKITDNAKKRIEGEKVSNRYDTLIQQRGGELIDVEFHLNRIDHEGSPVIVNVIRDIRDRKRMEEHIEYLYQVLLAIRNVNQLIVTEKDKDKLLKQATELLVESKGYLGSWIGLVDESMVLEKIYQTNYPGEFDLLGEKMGDSDFLCLTDNSQKVNVYSSDSGTCGLCPFRISGTQLHNILSARLVHEGKVYGVLTAAVPKGMIGQEELDLFDEVAGDISYALYGLEVEEDRSSYQDQLEALHAYASELGALETIEEIAESTVDTLTKVIGFTHCSFVIIEDNRFRHVLVNGVDNPHEFNFPIDTPSVLKRTYETGEAQIIPDVSLDPDFFIGPAEGHYIPKSELSVPIKRSGKVLGVINVESEELNAFTERDQQLLETVANHVAVAIDHLDRLEDVKETGTRLQEMLRQSARDEREKTLILDSLLDTVSLKTTDYRFIWVNKTLLDRLGISSLDDLDTSKPCYEINFGLDSPCPGCPMKETLETKKPISLKLRMPNGRINDIHTDVLTNEEGEIIGVLEVARDITDVTNMEQEMELLARLPEENTSPMLRVDKEGRLLYANPASDMFLNSQNLKVGDLIPEQMWMLVSETLRTGLQSDIEVPINQRHLAISIVPVPDKGYVNLYCRDITEQKKSDQRLDALYQHTIELIKTRTVEEVAETSLKIIRDTLGFEYSSFQLIEGDSLKTINYFDSSFPSGGNTENYMSMPLDGPGVTVRVAREGKSVLINDLNNTLYYVEGSGGKSQSELAVPIFSEEKVIGVLNVESHELNRFIEQDKVLLEIIAQHAGTAISRIRYTEAQESLKMEAEAAQEMDRLKTEFMNTATHEIRTPITSIKGYTELIREAFNQKDMERALHYFDVVSRNVSRLEILSNDLLDMQRLESGRITLTPMVCSNNEILGELESELSPIVELSNHVLIIEANDSQSYLCDKPRLLQVLVNLINNAAKYSPEGSEITLKVKEKEDRIYFSVTDRGIGIMEADMAKLFNPFPDIHVTGVSHGSGLGLSICKGIVELHGGEIWAESEGKDRGTTFTFYIPQTS